MNLLSIDLCGRLPYGVKCHFKYGSAEDDITLSCIDNNVARFEYGWYGKFHVSIDADYIKPYLRPMSSMTGEEARELLFVRLSSKYGESCAYIKNFIKLNEVSFRKEPPYEGSIAAWFSFENKIHDTLQIREYSKCEYLGQINDITLAEIDWLNKNMFDYRGLIPKGLAIAVTKDNNPYKK